MFLVRMVVLGVLSLIGVGCSPANRTGCTAWMQANGRVKVLCTTGMIQDLVEQIGGERVDVIALIGVEVDPHSYELVKGDQEKLQCAHLVFYNGLGLEHGASLNYQLHHHEHAVGLGDFLKQFFADRLLYVDGEVDPHVWMDMALWSDVIEPIVRALSSQDPSGASLYARRGQEVKQELMESHSRVYELVQSIPQEKRYIVTSHDAFNYFTRAYLAEPQELSTGEWQRRFDAPEGLAPEGQLSSFDITQVVEHLMHYDIHVVFPESNVSQDSLKKIVDACARKGFEVKLCHEPLYGDSMGPAGSEAGTYTGMILYDAQTLKAHL